MIDVAAKSGEIKTRFLVKIGNRLEVKYLDNVMLFYAEGKTVYLVTYCLLYTSPSPRDRTRSRMPSSA